MADNPYVNKVEYGGTTLMDITDTTADDADVAEGEVYYKASGLRSAGTAKYAGAAVNHGAANKTAAIPYGECDSTSTATAFTATVDGITSLYDGVTVMLRNGVVTSASGFTININGLGAKPVYSNMATGNPVTPTDPTRETTIFNINYTMLLVYDSNIVSGGGWICYRGYDANTNTIGYQLRTNSGNLPASDTGYRYRLWLTSADGTEWVPINTSTSTNATTARTLNTRAIDPFGPIVYNSTNSTVNADARPSVTTLWQQYALTVGYSYVLSMTAWKPVYLKCTPQTNGSAVMNALTQTLPSSKDGFIYIYLGLAYSATAMELRAEHPVYWHDGTGIRIWSGAEPSSGGSTVSVTQVQTSGTEIAQISVDGNSTSIYAPSGGSSSSVSYTATTATLPVAGWSDNTQTVSVSSVTATSDIIITAAPASISDYTAAGIYCSAQAAGSLTFTCSTVPTSEITVNLMIFEGGTKVAFDVTGTIDGSSYSFATEFVPTTGQTYNAHFSCSDTSIGYQGDVTLTAVVYGRAPTLTPTPDSADEEWYVQFLEGSGGKYGELNSSWFVDGETVSLTVYE